MTSEIEGKEPPIWLRVLNACGAVCGIIVVYMFLQVDDLVVRIGGAIFGGVLVVGNLILGFALRRRKG